MNFFQQFVIFHAYLDGLPSTALTSTAADTTDTHGKHFNLIVSVSKNHYRN